MNCEYCSLQIQAHEKNIAPFDKINLFYIYKDKINKEQPP